MFARCGGWYVYSICLIDSRIFVQRFLLIERRLHPGYDVDSRSFTSDLEHMKCVLLNWTLALRLRASHVGLSPTGSMCEMCRCFVAVTNPPLTYYKQSTEYSYYIRSYLLVTINIH